jgi:transcriptional regulator with XRE-family HTH domain
MANIKNIKNTIGKKLQNERLKSGYTQEEVAKRAKVSRSLIAKYEAGWYKDISIRNLINISRALRIPVMRLIA